MELYMKFSIIIPVYNVEKYIRRCITSILKQTYTDFEAIFVVDGSPDNSLTILNEYTNDSRVRIIEKENGGATSARKMGAINAKGEYIVCVDGDDYINEELLEKLNKDISANHADMICYGYETDCDSSPRYNMLKSGVYSRIEEICKYYLHDFRYKDCNSGCLFYTLWTKAVKKDVFVECQLKVDNHIKNGEDLLLIAWFLSKVNTVSVIEYSGYVYCDNDQSTTKKRIPYDLVNVSNVVNEMELIGVYPLENICYYFYYAIYVLTRDLARQSDRYSDFKKIVNDNLKMYCVRSMCDFIGLLPFNMKLRFVLIRSKMWILIYLLVKLAGN